MTIPAKTNTSTWRSDGDGYVYEMRFDLEWTSVWPPGWRWTGLHSDGTKAWRFLNRNRALRVRVPFWWAHRHGIPTVTRKEEAAA